MTLILSGTNGVSDVDGTAATPAVRGSDSNTGLFFPAADTIAFAEGGVESMRLDSAGNLGLGVTPSAKLDVVATNFAGGPAIGARYNTSNARIGFNIANANGFPYIGYNTNNTSSSDTPTYDLSQAAAQLRMDGGQFRFNIASSGTAGNAISFTQAMTLDASGNLLVGSTGAAYAASGRGLIEVNGTSTAFYGIKVSGTAVGYLAGGATNIELGATGYTSFVNNGSERARIDSSGNLLVGTTSAFTAAYTGVNAVQISKLGDQGYIAVQTTQTASRDALQFINPNGVVGSIRTAASSTSYNTSSDYRLKENVQPMTGALAKVAALKPCTYNWKADGSDGEGFIAHELQAVVPQCVTGEKDAVDAEGKPVYQGIDTSFLVATLTAALQETHALIKEQQTKIESLTTRIAALEGV